MTNRRLLIASPAKSGVPTFYMTMFESLVRRPPAGWDVSFIVEAGNNALNISRNMLAAEAIDGGFDRMVMLDLDHPVTAEHFVRLLSHGMLDDDIGHEAYPIVSGLYCMKKPGNPFFLGIRERGAKEQGDGLLLARFLPTGFLSVSVAALRTMCEFHKNREFYVQDDTVFPAMTPAPKKTKRMMTELFPIGINGPRTPDARLRKIKELFATGSATLEVIENIATRTDLDAGYLTGEDYFFSHLAHQAGIKQYLDVRCVIPHCGAIDFPITNKDALATSCQPIPEYEGDVSGW
jgi:hypothetical protein